MQPNQTSWLLRLRENSKARRDQRRLREQQPPWLLRHCPQNLRKFVAGFYMFMGMFSMVLFGFALLGGFIAAPLMYAQSQHNSLLAGWLRQYLHWLHGHFSQENFGPAYCIIQACIAGISLYFIRAFKWVARKPKNEKPVA